MYEILQRIVKECVGEEGLVVTAEMSILSDLKLDSLEMVQVICAVEDAFGIEVPDEEFSKLKTIQDLLDLIQLYT